MLGVSKEHIQWLKESKVCSHPQNEYCYVVDEPSKSELVPVNKIVGLGMRGESNSSWWEHFLGEKGNLERLPTLISSLNSIGLNQFIETFQSEGFSREVKIEYYADKDIYYTISGQHRTTMAKVVNAPYILGEVSVFRLDPRKQKEHELKIQEIEKVRQIMKNLDFEFKGNKICWRDNYVIPNILKVDIIQVSLINTKDLIELLDSLEKFRDAVTKFENFQVRILSNPLLRLKINIQKKLGIYTPLTKYEKKIIDLKKKGWEY